MCFAAGPKSRCRVLPLGLTLQAKTSEHGTSSRLAVSKGDDLAPERQCPRTRRSHFTKEAAMDTRALVYPPQPPPATLHCGPRAGQLSSRRQCQPSSPCTAPTGHLSPRGTAATVVGIQVPPSVKASDSNTIALPSQTQVLKVIGRPPTR